ncbi:MAG: hypothetical protein IJS15_03990 [Victivallales bacterium]|nr:hypothetical protein [Victivallales bacterium]
MKKMMFLACLIFSVAAITASAVTVDEMKSAGNSEMVQQLSNLDAAGWCEYLNVATESGDDALIKKVIVNAQQALNGLADEQARAIADAVNEQVSEVKVARYLTGKYALAYLGSVNSDGKDVKVSSIIDGDGNGIDGIIDNESFSLKTGKIGKGVGTVDTISTPATRY